MSHDYHEGPDDAVLYDGCGECEARAATPIDGLLNMDGDHFSRLWDRMRAVEYAGSDSYRTVNEAAVGRHLYYMSILLERHASVMTS